MRVIASRGHLMRALAGLHALLFADAPSAVLEHRRPSHRIGPGKRSVLGRFCRVSGYSGAKLRLLRKNNGVGRPPRTKVRTA